ncbi:hypothetical protein QFC21_001890 [Naganishia friedmannii]|uniref:Uncharacterized protein n=1 Tax=Naganishia friedmannii TaxID=89922 RepID=A0ACC2W1A1_9TREE|nr:hypothetical protein QFC21_001890 [Naganishia friedmannii]
MPVAVQENQPSSSKVNGRTEEEEDLEIDYSEIEEKYAVSPLDGFDNVLVVDNVPVIDEGKKKKLYERLRSTIAKAGAPLSGEADAEGNFSDMVMPWDNEKGESKGYMFLTYPSAELATHALRCLDQVLFGKNRLYVNRFGEIERYASMNIEEGSTPKNWPADSQAVDKEHLRSWLADPQGRDQFVTFRDTAVEINWCGRNATAERAVEPNPKWAELFVSWSPLGTYFTTLHRPGVALWQGKSFSEPHRFTHPGVRLVDFSPCENYLVTFAPEPIVASPQDPDSPPDPRKFAPEDEGNHIAVWEVKTGLLLRTFPGEAPSPPPPAGVDPKDLPPPRKLAWPLLRWSPDDKYVARCLMGSQISVYEAPTMGLLDKKSIKIDGVLDFDWCPDAELSANGKENMLAFWTPEVENQPARVSLMAIPSRTTPRQKNLYNVADVKLHWQDQGTYLCCKVDRLNRSKKVNSSNLELFRVKEKDYPIEAVELKEVCSQFAWEPKGSRFAMVTTSEPNAILPPGQLPKNNVEFFHVDSKKGIFRLMRRLENKTTNSLSWSPKGRFIVLATIGLSIKHDLEFWDLDFTTDDKVHKNETDPGANMQLLATGEHYGMSEIAWDPSGRYVASTASSFRNSPEPGYTIWDFKGQDLSRNQLDKFKQFLWRPRPATVLGKDEQKKIRKNLREYSKRFDEEDAAEESNVSAELIAHRRRLIDEWNAWRAKRIKELAAERQKAGLEAIPAVTQDEERETVEEWIEETIDETEEVVMS